MGARLLLLMALMALLITLGWSVGSIRAEAPAADSGRVGERAHVELRLIEGRADLSELAALGFELELALPDLGRAQGWIEAARLGDLRSAAGVREVATPRYAVYARGSAISEGDEALGAAAARERFGVDGSGVRVAIISDGIRGLAAAQERGDAPQLAEALGFGSGWLERGAEGTAMIELVHDLAPGAALSFGAVATDLDMIAAVRHFAQRVDVIVDDVGFLYPDDQQSDVSRNTAAALSNPEWPLRAYITAAGNWAQTHWSGRFARGSEGRALGLPNPGPLHEWRAGDPINEFRLPRGSRVVIALHWAEPWGRAEHDFDLYLLDSSGRVAASSEQRQAVDTLNPQEVLTYTNEGGAGRFGVVVQNWRGAAEALELELFVLGSADRNSMETLEVATGASSLLAQADAGGGVITVAAITPGETGLDRTAAYSSQGPTNNGAAKPDIAAIDGVRISGATEFGSRFFGTSAAAPHVAGVAALLLEAQPSLLARDGGTASVERGIFREVLLETAIDIGAAGRDAQSGAGRIDAVDSIAAARERIALVSSAADRGAGTLRAAIEAVNAGEALYIAFDGLGSGDAAAQGVITLESALPALTRDGAVLDGAGWRLDARNAAVGLAIAGAGATLAGIEVVGASDAGVVVRGAGARLVGVRAERNGRGVVIGAAGASLEGVVAAGNRGPGVVAAAGGSGRISGSWIGLERDGRANGNAGAGVLVEAGAGLVVVGAAEAAQLTAGAANGAAPIAPLGLAALEPRSGGVHLLRGTLLIDGLPAPAGTVLDLWLDRRSAGSATVGAAGWFEAAAAGPGKRIRFSVDGAALEEQLDFAPEGSSQVLLRARAMSGAAVDWGGGNRIAYNAGAALAASGGTSGGASSSVSGSVGATLRGNEIWSNGGGWIGRDDEQAAPRIAQLSFARGAASLRGAATGAASVDLYGARGAAAARYLGSAAAHYLGSAAAHYLGSAAVREGAFRFARIDVGELDRFWVVAHDARGAALGASAGWAFAPAPRIAGVSPEAGGYGGGELITISGSRFRVGEDAPRVFVGGAEASVLSADGETIVVAAPATEWRGATDVAVLRSDGRVARAAEAYRYDELRRVRLREGWNAVSWLGPPTRITAALAPIAQEALRAYAWDAAEQRWLAFSPAAPAAVNTLRRLGTGAILWLLVEGEVVWGQPLGGG